MASIDPQQKDMITFTFWMFIFCCLFEIKTSLLILQAFLAFATKHGADGALPSCIMLVACGSDLYSIEVLQKDHARCM